ncbi:hypothetical protein CCMSSC00406_0004641 [Pleurotus cornucopiae]|uniref:Uncharacterized protein n=1 Tax=Pleurotus cornucopiae TaxID=5321 RepID=A0ACB7IWV2_PLECO|nr:hypothetical protein CCMSSC00406_0004641 [Pleurotus cornucopiae]
MAASEERNGQIRLVGALAGMGSGLTKTPRIRKRMSLFSSNTFRFDTIKTRLQCSPAGTYRNALDCLGKLVRNEGILALYKGATPPAVGWTAIDSVLLGSLHNYRLFLIRSGFTEPTPGHEEQRLTILGHGVAGLFAGVTSAFVATPMELIKVKLQLQLQNSASERQFKGPIDCIHKIYKVQGIAGLWTGLPGSLAFRSNFFWMFLSFEILMRSFGRLKDTPYEISTGTAHFLSGGLGAFAYWAMAIPADNIKNRMMAYPYPQPYPTSIQSDVFDVKPSFLRTARLISAESGVAGFYRGLGPCLLRAFPVNACAFFVYEGTMKFLGAEKTRH